MTPARPEQEANFVWETLRIEATRSVIYDKDVIIAQILTDGFINAARWA